jgi:hypothetical protein
MIYVAVCRGLLSDFSVGNVGGPVLSHLLFVDDALIFCGANLDHLKLIRLEDYPG